MQIEVRERGIAISAPLRTYIERRLTFALGRFSPRIKKVLVRLQDVNGYKGGVDQQCQLAVVLQPCVTVVFEACDSDVFLSIAQAADKAANYIARHFKRAHSLRLKESLRSRLPSRIKDEAAEHNP
jgi:ribosomal subunit interface protein